MKLIMGAIVVIGITVPIAMVGVVFYYVPTEATIATTFLIVSYLVGNYIYRDIGKEE
jgi:hypothetical protein